MFRYRTRAVVLAGVVCTFVAWGSPVRSQRQLQTKAVDSTGIYLLAQAEADTPEAADEAIDTDPSEPAEPAPKAISTENPTIPVDELKLLLKPFTLAELETEAAAWMELVKEKVKEVSNAEIAIKRKNRLLEQEASAASALRDAEAAMAEAQAAQKAATPGSPEAEEANKKLAEAQEQLTKAQEAISEATDTREEIEGNEEVQKAVEEAQTDVEEGGKTAAEKEEERKEELKEEEEAAAPKPDPYEFDLYCNQYGYASYVDIDGVEISCTQDAQATDPQDNQATEETDPTAEKLDQAVSDIDSDSGGEQTAQELEKKEAQLDEAAQTLEENKEKGEELKTQLVVNVTTLQSERTALIDRLKVVLSEMEVKGGDPAAYMSYVQAVSGVEIDVTDSTGLGIRMLSWLQSEEGGIRWGINIAKFLGILVVAIIVSNVASRIVYGTMSKFNASALLREFVVMLIKRGGAIIGFLLALTALEISLGPVFAVLGGASFVLAFALQSNLGNLASGLMIMAYKPFDIGDEVKISGMWGFIESITLANTKIIGFKKQVVTIPNNQVWGGQIENYTAGEIRAWSFEVKLPYDQDLQMFKDLWAEVAGANPLVLKNPPPWAFVWGYDGYSVAVYCSFKTKKDDFWTAYEELFISLNQKLKERGINVAIPTSIEIERDFQEFSKQLALNKANGTNGHQHETEKTGAQRDNDVTGRVLEEADTTGAPLEADATADFEG
jgi:small conductance mechanosensitive channel